MQPVLKSKRFSADIVPHARKTALSPCSSTALSRFSHNKNTSHQKNGNVVKGITVIKWNWFPCWQATAACAVYNNISEALPKYKSTFQKNFFYSSWTALFEKKKIQVVISIVYNKELTEVRRRDLHVTGCATHHTQRVWPTLIVNKSLPENLIYWSLPLVMVS